jgi:excisionase family DNA binding protein
MNVPLAREIEVTDAKEVMNATEAARYLGTHVETVRRLARSKQIPSFKVGKDWRFRRNVLQKWAGTENPGGKVPLVLIVDHDPDVRQFVGLKIRKLGYRVVEAGGSDAALLSIYLETPGLILVDPITPGMNGIHFLAELRASHPELPVALVVGNPGSEPISAAIQYGPFLVLAKPVSEKRLEHVLHLSLGDTKRIAGKEKREDA